MWRQTMLGAKRIQQVSSPASNLQPHIPLSFHLSQPIASVELIYPPCRQRAKLTDPPPLCVSCTDPVGPCSQLDESGRWSAGQAWVRAPKSSGARRSQPLSPHACTRSPRTPSALSVFAPYVCCAYGPLARLRRQNTRWLVPPCQPIGRQGSESDSPWRDGGGTTRSRCRCNTKLLVSRPSSSCR